ncbi:CMP-N-acetylneuraminate-beta-galactosamide-alpha-2,3-sialyltransferase 2 [Bagarius yarrelli]|uniref:CMP-N-acetylneuraminate-beta-galactosamide-alpha-2,3-sialyltransferase 2 n=1 Tax=Bagarius yarrelli TaxID=175774 RepID=A0A556V1S5_BAGYA|nr:CMP-N-acetylneuraminate-beta-galactosamide-alpha-2,3-sialyltransferase 2 [Bagarius yarrelli]
MKLKVPVVSALVWTAFLLLFVRVEFRFHLDDFLDFAAPKSCACTSCVLEPQVDPWFTERYDSRVPKLMNRANSNLSPLTYKWWTKLQAYHNANLSDVVGPLFSLFRDEEHYNDSSPNRCRTCAVVGNSANLIRSHYGALIDAHDFVFRMNKGPTKGYERDVGAKTTHRAMYPESAVNLDTSTHLVLMPFKVLDLQWLISVFTTKNITKTYFKVKSTIKANKDKVNIFGFGASSSGRWYHYFDHWHHPLINSGVHRGGVEYQVILKLVERQRIQMYKGCAVVDTLFHVIPGEQQYMDAGPSRCRSCSVVGNSGNLRSSHYGKLIDSSDFVIRPSFMRYVHEVWLDSHGRYPSTGFLSLVLSLHICDQVNVFGFGADQQGNWHHYWEHNTINSAFKETGVHDADFEYNITQLLAQKRKISLFKGI